MHVRRSVEVKCKNEVGDCSASPMLYSGISCLGAAVSACETVFDITNDISALVKRHMRIAIRGKRQPCLRGDLC